MRLSIFVTQGVILRTDTIFHRIFFNLVKKPFSIPQQDLLSVAYYTQQRTVKELKN